MKHRTLIMIAACVLLGACGNYRTIRVEVLRPAMLDVGGGESKILLADRNIIHAGDTLFTRQLAGTLGVTRGDLVAWLAEGFADGLAWSEKPASVERAGGLPGWIVPDSLVPPPLAPVEIAAIASDTGATCLVTVEYCDFRLVDGNRLELDDNMLLRVHALPGGTLLGSVASGLLPSDVPLTAGDYRGSIRDFFYQKGWSLAEHLLPCWVPEERRIYRGHRLLDFGDYCLEQGDETRALAAWTRAMERGGSPGARAAVNVSWLLERQGDFEEAARVLEQALGHRTTRVHALERLAALRRRVEEATALDKQLGK